MCVLEQTPLFYNVIVNTSTYVKFLLSTERESFSSFVLQSRFVSAVAVVVVVAVVVAAVVVKTSNT